MSSILFKNQTRDERPYAIHRSFYPPTVSEGRLAWLLRPLGYVAVASLPATFLFP